MGAALGIALAASVCAGCGSAAPLAGFPPARPVASVGRSPWTAIADGMPAHLDLASPDVCGRGTPSCMDAVVAEMTRRLAPLAASCSHLAPFALMYRQVSIEVGRSVRLHRYQQPAYVAHLDAVFSTLYYRAIDEWRSGDRNAVPKAWQVAFAAADDHRVSALGDMLLGMNAHVSRDLAYAIAGVGLRHSDGSDATADVIAVNNDINRAQGPTLLAVARRFDPSVATVSSLGSRLVDPSQIASIIAQWRLESIRNAEKLIAAKARSRAALEQVETTIDDNATVRALIIEQLTAYRNPADALARDRYCERTEPTLPRP